MIEFHRYIRLKPQGLVTAIRDSQGVKVDFKRFDVENGKELEPERCYISYDELEAKRAELEAQIQVVIELLALKG